LPVFEKDVGTKGTSLLTTCKALRLNCTMWDYNTMPMPQHQAFVNWTKHAIDAGEPVIFGVYENSGDDKEFDHIVPMVGYDKDSVSFNDLYHNETQRYNLQNFVKSREECSKVSGEFKWCLPNQKDYGVIVHGNADANQALLRVQMTVSSRTEPDYSQEDGLHQTPVNLSGHVTVSGLSSGSRYALLRYDDPSSVPSEDFLHSSFAEKIEFVASANSYSHDVHFMSNSTVLFRCVSVASHTGTRRLRGSPVLV